MGRFCGWRVMGKSIRMEWDGKIHGDGEYFTMSLSNVNIIVL